MKSLADRFSIFDTVNNLIMGLIILITLYPFYYCFIISLNNANDPLISSILFLPRKFTLENYAYILKNELLLVAFRNSVLRTILGTIIHIIITATVSYGLSRKNLSGKKAYITFFVIPMYFNGGIITTYILIKNLGLINNFLVYIIPLAFSFFHVILYVSYFETIHESIEESAVVDGAGGYRILWQIIMPISLPITATIALYAGVTQWNSWYDTMIYTSKDNLETLQHIMMKLIQQTEIAREMNKIFARSGTAVRVEVSPFTLRVATLIVTTFPITISYPFLQKYFIKGMTLGAVKG